MHSVELLSYGGVRGSRLLNRRMQQPLNHHAFFNGILVYFLTFEGASTRDSRPQDNNTAFNSTHCCDGNGSNSTCATMARRMCTIALLLSSNAAAFVVPTASRSIVSGLGRDPLSTAVRTRTRAHRRVADSTAPTMRYIAMNTFKVKLGCEEEFETMWRERESTLADFSGFEQFMLLRIDEGKEENEEGGASRNNPGYTQFISHTTWAHQMDFEEWKRSQAFKKSHGGPVEKQGEKTSFVRAGGMSKMGDYIDERPVATLYHAVIMEPVPPEHAGSLWDFENEPSYFDGDCQ